MTEPPPDIVRRATSGDRIAFEELVDRVRPRLYRAVNSRLGKELRGRLEADDVLQETLLKALSSIDRFEWRGEGSFLSWLTGIAEHILRDQAGRHRLRRVAPLDRDVPNNDESPSVAVRREERFIRLEEALSALPREYKELIVLARVEGLPIQEIASRVGITPNAVSQRLWRALRRLREQFGDTESFHLPPRRLGEVRNPHD